METINRHNEAEPRGSGFRGRDWEPECRPCYRLHHAERDGYNPQKKGTLCSPSHAKSISAMATGC